MDSLKELGIAGVALLIGIIGFFLRQKDEQQGKQITTLWTKHDEDAKALAELKERIAREHYLKHELDARFESLERSLVECGSAIRELPRSIELLTGQTG